MNGVVQDRAERHVRHRLAAFENRAALFEKRANTFLVVIAGKAGGDQTGAFGVAEDALRGAPYGQSREAQREWGVGGDLTGEIAHCLLQRPGRGKPLCQTDVYGVFAVYEASGQ